MWTLKCELRSIQDRSKGVWTLSQSELRSISDWFKSLVWKVLKLGYSFAVPTRQRTKRENSHLRLDARKPCENWRKTQVLAYTSVYIKSKISIIHRNSTRLTWMPDSCTWLVRRTISIIMLEFWGTPSILTEGLSQLVSVTKYLYLCVVRKKVRKHFLTRTLLEMGFQTYIFCSKVPSKCRKCRFRDPNIK